MRITKAIVQRAKDVEALQSTSYRTGDTDVLATVGENAGKPIGIYTQLADFPYNKFGQTPRQLCSFTASLAHLISIDRSFITALTEEAAWYIDEDACAEYEKYLALAAKHNNLQPPEGLQDAA
jgi:hypothetical protein